MVKSDVFVHHKLTTGAITAGTVPHGQWGGLCREVSMPGCTQHILADWHQPASPQSMSVGSPQKKQKGDDLFTCIAVAQEFGRI